MMNTLIMIPLSVATWAFTLFRLRTILRERGSIKPITLNIWCSILFLSIDFTFQEIDFATFVNQNTFPDLSLLIYNSAFLIAQYFGLSSMLISMGIKVGKKIIPLLKILLSIELSTLLFIYLLHLLSKTKPEGLVDGVGAFWGISMFIVLITIILRQFPTSQFLLMRLRTILILICLSIAAGFLFTKVVLLTNYSLINDPTFTLMSYLLLIGATLFYFLSFLNHKVYAQIILLAQSIESWRTFQDLQCLMRHVTQICEPIGLPAEYPGFLRFLSDPEYYQYRAVIVILDGKVMLAEFLSQVAAASPEMKALVMDERDELIEEAERIHAALQAVETPGDFSDIVETYRRVSRQLFAGQMIHE